MGSVRQVFPHRAGVAAHVLHQLSRHYCRGCIFEPCSPGRPDCSLSTYQQQRVPKRSAPAAAKLLSSYALRWLVTTCLGSPGYLYNEQARCDWSCPVKWHPGLEARSKHRRCLELVAKRPNSCRVCCCWLRGPHGVRHAASSQHVVLRDNPSVA